MAKSVDRFIIQSVVNKFGNETKLLIDRSTGVNYLWHAEGAAAGLTVLVDQNGQPIVTPVEN